MARMVRAGIVEPSVEFDFDSIDPEQGRDDDLTAAECIHSLSRLLLWIADARTRRSARTRAHAVRYILGHATMRQLARESHVSHVALHHHVEDFCVQFPAIASYSKSMRRVSISLARRKTPMQTLPLPCIEDQVESFD